MVVIVAAVVDKIVVLFKIYNSSKYIKAIDKKTPTTSAKDPTSDRQTSSFSPPPPSNFTKQHETVITTAQGQHPAAFPNEQHLL